MNQSLMSPENSIKFQSSIENSSPLTEKSENSFSSSEDEK